ncbi:MAG: hypothetical protein EAZ85_06325 [Bacteroidetes bacterium]|nr:MAG: hypothetical protein EAZ85_06325 [Bacteroidota bacterium]TAG87114.1 MAG: hypothetical protein EAZ20_11330 [Bacteroidota bacterium]
MRNFIIYTTLVIFLFACAESGEKTGKDLLKQDKEGTKKAPKSSALSKEVLSDIMKSIPLPIEILFLIKELSVPYEKKVLSNADDFSKYNNNYKQSVNLGIYSTDLGYANIYGQTQDALNYLTAVKGMADGLKIGEHFDFNTIKKLAGSKEKDNFEKLLLETNKNLENINEHLQEKGRPDLTILILTAGWVEALYLTCEIAKKKPDPLLSNRIGDQKIVLDQLLLLLSFYDDNSNIKSLIEQLNRLQKMYENVKITIKTKEASVKTSGDVIEVGGESESIIEFTSKDLDNILGISKEIRNKMAE